MNKAMLTSETEKIIADRVLSNPYICQGLRQAAEDLGTTYSKIGRIWYTHLKQKYPQNKNPQKNSKILTPEHALTEKTILECVLSSPSITQGSAKAAEILGISKRRARDIWYKRIRPNRNGKNTETILNNVAKGRTEITKEDIDEAALKAGVHYHEALSTWASMSTHHKVKPYQEEKEQEKEQDRKKECWKPLAQCHWAAGEWYDKQIREGKSLASISRVNGISKTNIENKVKTFRSFPAEDDRDPSLSYSCHQICAHTSNPKEWLKRAKENDWSTRKLSKAISSDPAESVSRLKKEIVSLKTQIKDEKQSFSCAADYVAKEMSEKHPTVGDMLSLYQKIAEQEVRIRALQKFNLTCLGLLKKRNLLKRR